MTAFAALALLFALGSACAAQLLLRRAAQCGSRRLGVIAVVGFAASVVANFAAARTVGIGTAYVVAAASHLAVPAMAAVFLREPLHRRQLQGGALIAAGVLLYAL